MFGSSIVIKLKDEQPDESEIWRFEELIVGFVETML